MWGMPKNVESSLRQRPHQQRSDEETSASGVDSELTSNILWNRGISKILKPILIQAFKTVILKIEAKTPILSLFLWPKSRFIHTPFATLNPGEVLPEFNFGLHHITGPWTADRSNVIWGNSCLNGWFKCCRVVEWNHLGEGKFLWFPPPILSFAAKFDCGHAYGSTIPF